ncbi:hypothetical protein QG37_00982 [Candidozyma auris]|nr:hypothetical protein QG37_00982 [[Candida] auris]
MDKSVEGAVAAKMDGCDKVRLHEAAGWNS